MVQQGFDCLSFGVPGSVFLLRSGRLHVMDGQPVLKAGSAGRLQRQEPRNSLSRPKLPLFSGGKSSFWFRCSSMRSERVIEELEAGVGIEVSGK